MSDQPRIGRNISIALTVFNADDGSEQLCVSLPTSPFAIRQLFLFLLRLLGTGDNKFALHRGVRSSEGGGSYAVVYGSRVDTGLPYDLIFEQELQRRRVA